MQDIRHINKVIEKELETFSARFHDLMDSPIPLMQDITLHILNSGGKHIRPVITLLSAKMFGEVTPAAQNAALMIETLHSATLIHDDVVDESCERRGKPSVNSLWGPKLAVLSGDFLLAQCLNIPVRTRDMELLDDCTQVVKELIEGEILQSQASVNLDNTEALYFDIIRKKTAVLLAVCAKSGARAGGANPDQIAVMEQFGEILGLMFQIKDDLFDYLPFSETGKPAGNDLKEKKVTLPLLHALTLCTPDEKSRILHQIQTQTPNLLENARNMVDYYQGVSYAIQKMESLCEQARSLLQEMPDNEARKALSDLADYIISRNK